MDSGATGVIILIWTLLVVAAVLKYTRAKEKRKKKTNQYRNKNQKQPEYIQYIYPPNIYPQYINPQYQQYPVQQNIVSPNIFPYHKKELLTKNEYYFYKKINQIANEKGLQVLTKIRLADLIDVNQGLTKQEWNVYFSKIKSKHIDFAIADSNMNIITLIELNDSSHERIDRIERDNFVANALRTAGYNFLMTEGSSEQVETYLNNILSYKS